MTEIPKITQLKVAGLFYYCQKGLCQACGRDAVPVVEVRGAYGIMSLCSDCCQAMMGIHEQHDL